MFPILTTDHHCQVIPKGSCYDDGGVCVCMCVHVYKSLGVLAILKYP